MAAIARKSALVQDLIWTCSDSVFFFKQKTAYELPLTRHFYVYTPPRPLEEIDAEIRQLEAEIQELLSEVTE